jgi:hypothetical protein
MKKCCDKPEKYVIEFTKREDNELHWSICEEHFQDEGFRKNVRRIQTVNT